MKLTKRKGFNFFRSYYDVYNELTTDKEKVDFIDALLDRQFLGTKPTDLIGMAKFAYISQTNSIDSQVKGYEDKIKVRLDGRPYYKDDITPTDGVQTTPTVGANEINLTPTLQEKEEEKEEEEEKEKEQKECVFNFLNSLIDLGIDKQVAKDWVKVRKTKKATNTETAFNAIAKEIKKAENKKTPNECATLAVSKSWAGFNYKWVEINPIISNQNRNIPIN